MKKLLLFTLSLLMGWQMSAQPSWTTVNTGITNSNKGYVSDIHVVNEQVAWVKAISVDASGNLVNTQEISKTVDGGANWTAYQGFSLPGIVNPGISNVFGISGDVAYIAAYKNSIGNGGVWKTVDGGTTWTKVSTSSMYSDAASFPNFVYFWDANNGMVQGDPVGGEFEIYTTSDGGTTWTQVSGSNIPNPVAADDYGVVFGFETAGNTLWFKTRYGKLFKTTDMGHTWSVISTPVEGTPTSTTSFYPEFTFKDDNEGWILKYSNGALYHTTDGGNVWNQMTVSGTLFKSEISFVPGSSNTLVTCGSSSGNFGTAYSVDGGASWVGVDTESHTSLGFFNNATGYSGQFVSENTERPIWKWHADPAAINDTTIEGLRVFPNPANDVVYVSTSESEVVAISIFDITGKEVVNMNNLSGYRTTINTSNLDKGIYLLKVTDNNNANQTLKLVIK